MGHSITTWTRWGGRGSKNVCFCPRSGCKNCPHREQGGAKMARFCPRTYWMIPYSNKQMKLHFWSQATLCFMSKKHISLMLLLLLWKDQNWLANNFAFFFRTHSSNFWLISLLSDFKTQKPLLYSFFKLQKCGKKYVQDLKRLWPTTYYVFAIHSSRYLNYEW